MFGRHNFPRAPFEFLISEKEIKSFGAGKKNLRVRPGAVAGRPFLEQFNPLPPRQPRGPPGKRTPQSTAEQSGARINLASISSGAGLPQDAPPIVHGLPTCCRRKRGKAVRRLRRHGRQASPGSRNHYCQAFSPAPARKARAGSCHSWTSWPAAEVFPAAVRRHLGRID